MTKPIAFETMLMYAESGFEDHYKYPYDCQCIDYEKNTDNGFYARAFYDKPTGQIIISISGTNFPPKKIAKDVILDSAHDLGNDINMALGNLPPQIETAIKFYNRVAKEHKGVKIIFTGYSLGGSQCQIMAKLTGCTAYTFNAFSTGDEGGKEYPNITNIINSEDFISMSDINTQPGKTYITPNRSGNKLMPKLNLNPPAHKLENLRLRDITEYKRGSIKSYFDKIRSGESLKYEAYGVALDTVKEVYALWDISKKLRGWYLDKKSELKQSIKDGGTYLNGNSLINKGDAYVKSSPENDKIYTDYGNNTFHLYARKDVPGHWVTIRGKHVFFEDK